MLARPHGGDVSLDDDRCTTADAIDLVGDPLRGCFVGSIVYDDGGTVLSQKLGDGRTDGPGRASDDCELDQHPVFEIAAKEAYGQLFLGGVGTL